MLLVFTHRRGFEADVVIDELRRREQPFLRYNADDDLAELALYPGEPERSWISCDGRRVELTSLRAGWFQQDAPNPALDGSASSVTRSAWINRMAALDLLLSEPSIRWLSSPDRVRAASNKPRQLIVASLAGMRTPETLVTNSLDAVSTLAADGKVIVKNLASPWLTDVEGVELAYTRAFENVAANVEQVRFAPLIYQRRIRRRRDVRVVVVGSELFAAAVDSDDRPDIRSIPLADADYRPYHLDEETSDRLRAVCCAFALRYASIDLAEDEQGRLYFLELNTTGAFLWLERKCRFPITAAIVDNLIRLVDL